MCNNICNNVIIYVNIYVKYICNNICNTICILICIQYIYIYIPYTIQNSSLDLRHRDMQPGKSDVTQGVGSSITLP